MFAQSKQTTLHTRAVLRARAVRALLPITTATPHRTRATAATRMCAHIVRSQCAHILGVYLFPFVLAICTQKDALLGR